MQYIICNSQTIQLNTSSGGVYMYFTSLKPRSCKNNPTEKKVILERLQTRSVGRITPSLYNENGADLLRLKRYAAFSLIFFKTILEGICIFKNFLIPSSGSRRPPETFEKSSKTGGGWKFHPKSS